MFAMTTVVLIMMFVFFSNLALRPYVFVTTGVILALMGWVNGYTTARLLKFFNATNWLGSACISAFALPSWLISSLALIDLIEWNVDSSAKIPFTLALAMVFGFLLFTVPLSMHGAYRGFTKAAEKPKVNLVRRLIPDQPWFTHPAVTLPLFGLIIFSSIYVEFVYMLDSMWHSYTIYAMFGFLLINLCLMTVVVGLLSIL